jgi:hypothetical protein
MEDFDREQVGLIAQASLAQVADILKAEPPTLPITKSLIQLLYNIVVVGSVPINDRRRAFFDRYTNQVLTLLSSGRSLERKKVVLVNHPELARNIAAGCPLLAGL